MGSAPLSLHVYIRANTGRLAFWAVVLTFTASASAETLDLNCARAAGSSAFRLIVDSGAGLVSDEGGPSGRRWAARVDDKNIIWDEVYDSRRGHFANHFVLDRATGVLRGTDTTKGGEILSAICQKAS
jgi:hypothetical protein